MSVELGISQEALVSYNFNTSLNGWLKLVQKNVKMC